MDGLYERDIKADFREQCKKIGDYIDLKGDSGIVYGSALKNSNTSSNPIYVTVGSYISLQFAIDIVVNCSDHRIPQPVRQADMLAKNLIQQYYSKHQTPCDKA